MSEASRGRGRGTPREGGTSRRGLELSFSTIPMTYHPSPSGSFHTTFNQCLWKVLTNLESSSLPMNTTLHRAESGSHGRVWGPGELAFLLPQAWDLLESHLISWASVSIFSKNGYSNVSEAGNIFYFDYFKEMHVKQTLWHLPTFSKWRWGWYPFPPRIARRTMWLTQVTTSRCVAFSLWLCALSCFPRTWSHWDLQTFLFCSFFDCQLCSRIDCGLRNVMAGMIA